MIPPDGPLSQWVTEFVGTVPIFDDVMSLFATGFFIPVAMALILLSLWFSAKEPEQRRRDQITMLAAATAFGFANWALWIINNNIGFNPWPHPFDVYPSADIAANMLLHHTTDPSFPSHGAAIFFALATGVWLGNRKKTGAVLYALATLWCLARFYCGVHYLSDIAAGAAIGAVIAYITSKYFFAAVAPLVRWIFRTLERFYLA